MQASFIRKFELLHPIEQCVIKEKENELDLETSQSIDLLSHDLKQYEDDFVNMVEDEKVRIISKTLNIPPPVPVNITDHFKTVNMYIESSSDGSFICSFPECNHRKQFASKSGVVNHIKSKHSVLTEKDLKLKQVESDNKYISDRKIFIHDNIAHCSIHIKDSISQLYDVLYPNSSFADKRSETVHLKAKLLADKAKTKYTLLCKSIEDQMKQKSPPKKETEIDRRDRVTEKTNMCK